jgi:hypothetical protein
MSDSCENHIYCILGQTNSETSRMISEAAAANKENEQIIDLKKENNKANREAQYQRILTCSKENNRPAYAFQNTANNITSSNKNLVKDVECDICQLKFTKKSLT